MKKILLTITIAAITLVSCGYDRLPVYEDVDRIYFEFASLTMAQLTVRKIDWNYPDRVQIRFGYDKVIKQDSVVQIAVKVMGRVAPYDRPVTAALIGDESTAVEGVDFDIQPSVIPANSLAGTLNIRLVNTDKIQTSVLLAKLRLTPNDHFHVDYTQAKISDGVSATEYSVYFDAKHDIPGLWADATSGARLRMYFGEYSEKKLEMMCFVWGFTRDYFEYDSETYATSMECLNARFPSSPTALASYWLMLNHYVLNWEKENGKDLLDENGKRLFDTFSPTQKAYI
jgi:hypothetical protein